MNKTRLVALAIVGVMALGGAGTVLAGEVCWSNAIGLSDGTGHGTLCEPVPLVDANVRTNPFYAFVSVGTPFGGLEETGVVWAGILEPSIRVKINGEEKYYPQDLPGDVPEGGVCVTNDINFPVVGGAGTVCSSQHVGQIPGVPGTTHVTTGAAVVRVEHDGSAAGCRQVTVHYIQVNRNPDIGC